MPRHTSVSAVVATMLAMGSFSAAPAAGAGTQGAVDLTANFASVEAAAFDGGGDDVPPPEGNSSLNFEDFTDQVSVSDSSSSEPGRNASSLAFQDTEMLGSSPFRGFDTVGSADAVTNDTDDEFTPEASATSEFSVVVQVSGGDVAYRAIGELETASNAGAATADSCSEVVAQIAGEVFRAGTPPCDAGTRRDVSFDETATLAPGTHLFEVTAEARADAENARDARIRLDFDVRVVFEGCTIVAEAGVPTVGTGERDVICGTEQGDDIRAGGGRDEIYGLGGVDSIEGEGDGDQIFGGDEGDIVVGGPGGDFFIGGGGTDSFSGGGDIDFAAGGPQDDQLQMEAGEGSIALGEGGNDTIVGGSGADDFDGGPGSDTLRGEGGQDSLRGEADPDCLVGGAAKDDFQGGDGNDKLLARDGRRDTGSGGPGPDRGRFDPEDTIASVANRGFQGGC